MIETVLLFGLIFMLLLILHLIRVRRLKKLHRAALCKERAYMLGELNYYKSLAGKHPHE